MRITLPPLEIPAALSGDGREVSKHLQRNCQLWRWINGAFGMLKNETQAFDTQQDYWYRTDRRIVAPYLYRRLRESCFPADLRALAQHPFRHFEGKVAAGSLGAAGLVREAEWSEYRGLYAPAVRDLPKPPEYGKLKARWKRLAGATLAEDVLQFPRDLKGLAAPYELKPDFFYRMQWLPHIGQAVLGGELALWRQLFFPFYTFFASFTQGGELRLARILQNNLPQLLLGHTRKWANGERPDQVGFRVGTNWEEKECSHYIPVAELVGFPKLDRYPYYDGVRAETDVTLAKGANDSAYAELDSVRAWTAVFLADHPDADSERRAEIRLRAEGPIQPLRLGMDGLTGSRALKEAGEVEARIEEAHPAERVGPAVANVREWSDRLAVATLPRLATSRSAYVESRRRAVHESVSSMDPRLARYRQCSQLTAIGNRKRLWNCSSSESGDVGEYAPRSVGGLAVANVRRAGAFRRDSEIAREDRGAA